MQKHNKNHSGGVALFMDDAFFQKLVLSHKPVFVFSDNLVNEIKDLQGKYEANPSKQFLKAIAKRRNRLKEAQALSSSFSVLSEKSGHICVEPRYTTQELRLAGSPATVPCPLTGSEKTFRLQSVMTTVTSGDNKHTLNTLHAQPSMVSASASQNVVTLFLDNIECIYNSYDTRLLVDNAIFTNEIGIIEGLNIDNVHERRAVAATSFIKKNAIK